MDIFLKVLFVSSRESNIFLCACLIAFYRLVFIHLEIGGSLARKKARRQRKVNIIHIETTEPTTRGDSLLHRQGTDRILFGRYWWHSNRVSTLRKSNPSLSWQIHPCNTATGKHRSHLLGISKFKLILLKMLVWAEKIRS